MKTIDELLQRCFDGDLNDDEMKQLFVEMSIDGSLRKQFQSLQTLRNGLRSIPLPGTTGMLDDRIKRLHLNTSVRIQSGRSFFQRIMNKKFSFSIPAFAAAVLLLIVGGYFTVTKIAAPKTETEFIYIMQLPQIEVYAIAN